MTKKEVQQRVLKDGKPLALSEFSWDEKTNTFSSNESGLVLDFAVVNGITFDTGDYCTFKTGSDCTFDTGSDCTFKTDSGCTFETGSDCAFNTGCYCTFHTLEQCVAVRRDVFELLQLTAGAETTFAPYKIPGHVCNGVYSVTGKPAIIADGILSEVISTRQKDGLTIRKVINHGETKESFLVERDGMYSHGKTLAEAVDSLRYKISSRDTSKYNGLSKDHAFTLDEAIEAYRVITGACEAGTRSFVERLETIPESVTVEEVCRITAGQFGNEAWKKFFETEGRK